MLVNYGLIKVDDCHKLDCYSPSTNFVLFMVKSASN